MVIFSKISLFFIIFSLFSSSLLAQAKENPKQELALAPKEIRLTLRDVIYASLKNNVGIAVQEYNSKIRSQDIIDEESKFDPTLSAEISAENRDEQVASAFAVPDVAENENKNWEVSLAQKLKSGADYKLNFTNRRNDTNSAFAGLNPQYSSTLNLTLTQPLLKNFGFDINKTNIYVASNNKEISDFDFKDKIIQTLADVEVNYWDLVFSIEDLKVKEKSLKRARDLERRVKAQVDVGTMAPLEILQAKSEVASREQLLVTATDLIRDNEDNLKNKMNINFSDLKGDLAISPLDRPAFKVEKEITLENVMGTALTKRPDYLSKKKELKNKNIQMKFNENQTFPSLDLFGTLGLNGIAGDAIAINQFGGGSVQSRFGGDYRDTLDNLFDTEFYNWQVGVKFSYPLGNRSAKSKLTASRLQVQQAILDIKDLERQIMVDVREAVRQIQTDSKRVEASRLARKLAEEKLSAEEKKFSVGLSTSFNVLEFQEDLAEEQSNEIKSIIDYNKSKIKLNRVIGETLDHHNIKFTVPEAP